MEYAALASTRVWASYAWGYKVTIQGMVKVEDLSEVGSPSLDKGAQARGDSTREGSRLEGIPSQEGHEFKVKVLEARLKEEEDASMFAKAGFIMEVLHYLLDQ